MIRILNKSGILTPAIVEYVYKITYHAIFGMRVSIYRFIWQEKSVVFIPLGKRQLSFQFSHSFIIITNINLAFIFICIYHQHGCKWN